ncbi:MAG: hypothetical protein ACRDGE_11695 [Candidatus Limnocylindria bacterium]
MRIPTALLVVLLLAACAGDRASTPPSGTPPPMLGVVWDYDGESSFVARLDPRSLEPLPGPRAPLGRADGPRAFSPDGSRVVFAGSGAIRVLDLERMRVLADVPAQGDFGAVAWPEPRGVLLATGFNWEIGVEAVVVDPLARRVLSRRSLGGSLQRFAPTDDGLLLLLGPRAGGIGPARLALLSADGSMPVLRLDSITAGFEQEELEGGSVVDHYRTPGLAVDPTGERAFVVTAADLVAEVDLRTLDVDYRELREPASLRGRLHNWLEPAAEAKGASDGSLRSAVWLGDGLLAVSGFDDHASFGDEGNQTQTTEPAGVTLVDTRTWSRRMLEPDATEVSIAGELLLVWNWETVAFEGAGLSAFDRAGERRFRLFEREPLADVQVVGRRAYVTFDDSSSCQGRIVDLQAGRVLGGTDLRNLCDRSLLSPDG